MGTSRGISTPSGGDWSNVKREITEYLKGPKKGAFPNIVGSVISAAGGLGMGLGKRSLGGMGAGGGGGGGTTARHSRRIGRVISGLGGFASAVQEQGLTEALGTLDLSTLEGQPAVEVIAKVSERLAEGLDGIDGELLRSALNDAVLDAVQLEGELGYADLEEALQEFLNTQGVSGLIELFLTQFVSKIVTAHLLEFLNEKTDNEQETEALLSGIEIVCRDRAQTVIGSYQTDGRLNEIDWFGKSGQSLGRELADSILTELTRAD